MIGAHPILAARAIEFGYFSSNTIQISALTIQQSEFWGVLGPNGAGKSTFLRLLAGLLTPRTGEVQAFGRPIATFTGADRAARIAWVPQRIESPFEWTVREMVETGRYPHVRHRLKSALRDREAVDEALQRVGLVDLADRELHQLSGGEWQRAVIARALAQKAPVLILDEPVANLDLRYQREIYELLAEIAHEGDGAVIAADHHVDLQAHFCDRMLLLQRGRALAEGTPREVVTEAGLEQAFGTAVRVEVEQGRPRVFWRFGDEVQRANG